MSLATLCLKKQEERRLRTGHVWIYSNEIDVKKTPIKQFTPGEEVLVEAHDKTIVGVAYVNPHSLITGRLFSRDPNARLDSDFFIQKIRQAATARERLFPKPYYRLVFGESDGLPGVVIDRFGDHYVIQINTAGIELKKDLLVSALQQAIPNVQSILLRNDSPTRHQEGLETYIATAFGTPPQKARLEENQTQFDAPLEQGQKTGWFYDHRMNRARLKDYVANQRVLDVFSYLGGWGIQAAIFGASEVTCVETSEAACGWIKENAELNNVATKIQIRHQDAFDALKELHKAKQTFDVIILDPPAFIKRQKDQKEGLLAYQRINEAALRLLTPGGILVSCSCSMHLKYDDLVQALRRASYRADCELQLLERGHQGPDHPVHLAIPETDYLKMVIVRRLEG
jgi:23S rRNA (cytosine1962-C5)-methyltransferase